MILCNWSMERLVDICCPPHDCPRDVNQMYSNTLDAILDGLKRRLYDDVRNIELHIHLKLKQLFLVSCFPFRVLRAPWLSIITAFRSIVWWVIPWRSAKKNTLVHSVGVTLWSTMVSTLNCRWKGLGLTPGQGYHVVFSSKTTASHLHPGVLAPV